MKKILLILLILTTLTITSIHNKPIPKYNEIIIENKLNNIIGNIEIPGTKINDIVMQYSNNEFYLNHNIYNNYDPKGTIFLDYRNTIEDKILLIYGHNSHIYDIPFKELEKYYDEHFFKNNKEIYLTIKNDIRKYEIFSIYIEYQNWSYTKIKLNTDEYLKHINKLKNKSWYESNINLTNEDNILILQTCSYHKEYEEYKNKYLLIIAREII